MFHEHNTLKFFSRNTILSKKIVLWTQKCSQKIESNALITYSSLTGCFTIAKLLYKSKTFQYCREEEFICSIISQTVLFLYPNIENYDKCHNPVDCAKDIVLGIAINSLVNCPLLVRKNGLRWVMVSYSEWWWVMMSNGEWLSVVVEWWWVMVSYSEWW